MKSKPSDSLLIDLIKAIASQLIVWHHLAAYSPMSDVLHPHAAGIIDWLYDDARLAVQVFLVTGGFLAARSLAPRPGALAGSPAVARPVGVLWLRYLRLARPYVVALGIAIVCAAIARALVADPDIPARPTVGQLLAHLFLLHDIAGVEALSAGVWYVAIDFQLYAGFALLLWLAHRLASWTGFAAGAIVVGAAAALSAASLLWLNRDPSFDEWGVYFFGAYSLGIFAHWAAEARCRGRCLPLIALLAVIALLIEWRSRIFVAGLTALVLASGIGSRLSMKETAAKVTRELGRMSYSLFLIHYPVLLVVGAVVARFWPEGLVVQVAGLLAAWLLSLGAGALLHHAVERGPRPSSGARLAPSGV